MPEAKKRVGKFWLFRLILCIAAVLLLLYAALKWYYPANAYETQIAEACEEWGVPVSVVYAVIKTESDFDASALSDKGAVGLMQLMPNTFSWSCEMRGIPRDSVQITNAAENIDAGVWYLSYLRAVYGDWKTIYAAYNAGQGRVDGWLAEAEVSILADIPFPETEKYVRRVTLARYAYRFLYGME